MFDHQRQKLEPSTNVIVFSDSGKPVFARHGTDEEVARISGLLQAVRTSILYTRGLDLGDIKSIRSRKLCIVFMTVESLTLVAIARDTNDDEATAATEAYLKLQLEYVYAHIILSLTQQLHEILKVNPTYHLRDVLSSCTEGVVKALLEEASSDPACFLTAGAKPLFPLSPFLRDKASHALQLAGDDNTVFAIVISDDKLVSLVQPSFHSHQLRVSDYHVLLQFVSRQPGLLSSELWLPLCLPRFNSKGFLYCYTNCLDVETKLVLVLVSQVGSTEQFQALRTASADIRRELGLKNTPSSVLEILASDITRQSVDVSWRRLEETNSDDDYVDASGDGDLMIPYVGGTRETENGSLLQEIKKAKGDDLCRELLELSGALHFVFRLNVPVRTARQPKGHEGILSQCISSPLEFPFSDNDARQRVWRNYEKLSLRLRLGSSTVEAMMDAFDMITEGCPDDDTRAFERDCPAMALYESPPNIQGVSFLEEGSEIFLAMNGKEFELFVTLPSSLPIKSAAAQGARLARRLILEQATLFLSRPRTWKE